jgi:hypothetical protein
MRNIGITHKKEVREFNKMLYLWDRLNPILERRRKWLRLNGCL